MSGPKSPSTNSHGLVPSEWETLLLEALESNDDIALEKTLMGLRKEMTAEVASLRSLETGPLISRLTEHARRLFQLEPTSIESLRMELDQERRVWADYRARYRRTFIPSNLHPFLKSCPLFLKPSTSGPQFPHFVKYLGATANKTHSNHLEAVTLFSPETSSPSEDAAQLSPPNFFSEFDTGAQRFIVKRAYRTVLPKGAGTPCILEHIRKLVPNPNDLDCLAFDNVKNSATYDVFVSKNNDQATLNPNPAPDQAPLVRLAWRILGELNLAPAPPSATLDRFGFLDLHIPVRKAQSR